MPSSTSSSEDRELVQPPELAEVHVARLMLPLAIVICLPLVLQFLVQPTVKVWETYHSTPELAMMLTRPYAQLVVSGTLKKGNGRVFIARDGTFILDEDMAYLLGPPIRTDDGPGSPLAVITADQRALAKRGIRCLTVLVPPKPVIHPDILAPDYPMDQGPPENPGLRPLIEALGRKGVPTLSLTPILWREARRTRQRLYLRHDDHWNPDAASVAAEAIAAKLEALGWCDDLPDHRIDRGKPTQVTIRPNLMYNLFDPQVRFWSDVPGLGSPFTKLTLVPATEADGTWYQPRDARIEVSGDSFCWYYTKEKDASGRVVPAGLPNLLAAALDRDVDYWELSVGLVQDAPRLEQYDVVVRVITSRMLAKGMVPLPLD